MVCTKCQMKNREGVAFCEACGAPMPKEEPAAPKAEPVYTAPTPEAASAPEVEEAVGMNAAAKKGFLFSLIGLICTVAPMIISLANFVISLIPAIGTIIAMLGSGISGIAGLAGFILCIVGVVMSKKAKKQIAETGEDGLGKAKAGTIMGIIGIVLQVIGIIMAVVMVLITVLLGGGALGLGLLGGLMESGSSSYYYY